MTLVGQKILHYRLVEKLGEGGMGVVYKAEDTKLQRTVALKFLPLNVAADAELRQRFINEARTASALNHPNICTIYSVEDSDDPPFIAMEFVEGKELREIVNTPLSPPSRGELKGGVLPIDEIITYATQIAKGLHAAHTKGIIHRDIKPANIMVTDEGLVKVMDFGLAKKAGQPALTKTGSTLGTMAYMSPEQARNEPVDHRSDIFSFGAVLYELCSGQQPFAGDYDAATLYSVVHEDPEALPDSVPSELRSVVFKCLEKQAEDRYQSAKRLLTDLRKINSGVTSSTRPAAGSQKQQSGNRAVLALAGAVVVLLALVTVQLTDLFKPDRTVLRLANPRQMTSFIGVEDRPSWSPDGGRLAYMSEQSGNLDIWVKQVAGGEPVNLTSSHDGADYAPSWSPDGSKIAFCSDRDGLAICVMPAIGGIPRKVATLEKYWWDLVQWSQDGTKLAYIASDSISGNWYVEILTLTTGATQRIPVAGSWPEDPNWSPDGGTFAYTLGAGQAQSIWASRIADGTHWRMTEWFHYDSYPSWSSDGRTFFFLSDRGGARDLWQMALDDQCKPDGAPIPVTTGLGMRSVAFSPDGKKLAYSKGGKVSNLWRVPISAPGAQAATWMDAEQMTFENAYIENVEISRAGKQVFFDSDRAGNQDLWVMSIEGKNLEQLTTDPTADFGPSLSPDGSEIAFHAYRSGNKDIWVMPVGGGRARRITQHPGDDFSPRWSPDGNQIAFGSLRGGNFKVWVISAQGGEARRVAEGRSYHLWWPDGKWLVYLSDTGLWRLPLAGGQPEPLEHSTEALGGSYRFYALRWSADQKHIYFLMSPGLDARNIWSLSVEDGSLQQLTDLEGRNGNMGSYALATDGEYLYFTWEEELGDIWVMDVERED